jgi:hypothetical protein
MRSSPSATILVLVALAGIASALPADATGGATPPGPSATRDGQRDFDFNLGVWKTHIRNVLDPLSGSARSIELEGTVTVRKVWGGRAQLEEIEADGPNGHWQGLTLFLYNPQAHQWSQTFVSSKSGVPSPPLIGAFKNGRGELYSQDSVNGRSILVRAVWSEITPDAHRYEESYSDDGGRTWAPAFIASLRRVEAPASDAGTKHADPVADAQHDFDFGAWKTHSSRLLHPRTGSTTWVELDGVTTVEKVWGGRANLAEYSAEGPAGRVELLALRWYNPASRQWSLNFATPGVGTLGVPCVGEFKNGRGDFYDQETIDGKSVLVRFSIWTISRDTAQSEQAFSADGGKTWETNWINRYTRISG